MRTSAKILRTIGRGLTWSGWGYAAPRPYGPRPYGQPWAYLGTPYYYLYRFPSPPATHADPASPVAGLPRLGR